MVVAWGEVVAVIPGVAVVAIVVPEGRVAAVVAVAVVAPAAEKKRTQLHNSQERRCQAHFQTSCFKDAPPNNINHKTIESCSRCQCSSGSLGPVAAVVAAVEPEGPVVSSVGPGVGFVAAVVPGGPVAAVVAATVVNSAVDKYHIEENCLQLRAMSRWKPTRFVVSGLKATLKNTSSFFCGPVLGCLSLCVPFVWEKTCTKSQAKYQQTDKMTGVIGRFLSAPVVQLTE